ncbi:MAG TPA: hypothetical protein VFU45_09815 [Gemmatimonadales bacterium]|nr:hypothetical protein [Gemmatimonadales bacterium]
MKTSTKVVTVTLLLAIAAFLTEPHGPFGGFWAPTPDAPAAAGIQVPLFMILGLVEALAFGLGVSFLFFGHAVLKAQEAASASLTRGAHLAISWLLLNWWAHDSLHLHNGMQLNGLLMIEYGFHVTLIIAGVTLARYFLAVTGGPAPRAAGA